MAETGDIIATYQMAGDEGLSPADAFESISDALSDIYEEEGWAALRTVIADLIDSCAETTKEAEKFVDGFFDIVAGGGDSLTDEDAWFFEDLVRDYPDSLKFVDTLASIYSELINQNDDTYFPKLARLSDEHPHMSGVALYYVYALVNLWIETYKRKVTTQQYTQAVQRVKELYEAHPREEFAEQYADGLEHLAQMQDNEEDAVRIIAVIEDLLDKWHDDHIAAVYLSALTRLTWLQDERGCAATIAHMASLWDDYPYSHEDLAMNMAYSLANYSLCVSGPQNEAVLQNISDLAPWWKPAARLASELRDGSDTGSAHKPKKAA